LLFEDDPSTGQVAFRCDLHGGFNRESHAQALAARVIQFLDNEAESKVMTVTPEKEESDLALQEKRIIY
jgi:hypothetical protein